MAQGFQNRTQAGRLLAARLAGYANRTDVLVLALPRGGVPVGFEVAQHLHVPLDVLVVRKLGVPGNPEFAMGALASGGVRVLYQEALHSLNISPDLLQRVTQQETAELHRREVAYRGQRPPPAIRGKIVFLIDDGLATGSTMRAAAQSVRAHAPGRTIIAVPVAPPSVHEELADAADEIIALITPEKFYGVGQWYAEFSQNTDEEVIHLLGQAWGVTS